MVNFSSNSQHLEKTHLAYYVRKTEITYVRLTRTHEYLVLLILAQVIS